MLSRYVFLPIVTFLSLTTSAFAQMYCNFEDGVLSQFTQSPVNTWKIADTAIFLDSNAQPTGKLLQHSGAFVGGNSTVNKISTLPKPNKYALCDTFRFLVRHGYTGSTSSNNYWLAVLASNLDADAMDVSNPNFNAYAVGTYPVDKSLKLKFLKFTAGVPQLLKEFSFSKTNVSLQIEVVRGVNGDWNLRTTPLADVASAEHLTVVDTTAMQGENFGFIYAFSSTAASRFYVDNIFVNIVERPLRIVSVQQETPRRLRVAFNRALAASAVNAKFSINAASDAIYAVDSVKQISASTLQIFLDKELQSDTYMFAFENLATPYETSYSGTFDFALYIPQYGDIVFSELMIKPNSEGPLPDEYIELYNRTANAIDLSGWTISNSTRRGRITAGVIRAGGYALIGNNMVAYSTVIAVDNRPTLTDAGGTLGLTDGHGVLIDSLAYNDSWYADVDKQDGGYSLEKIDLNNLEETVDNWRASIDERGGTPGIPNFVAAANPDVTLPACIGYSIFDNVLTLNFSEVISEKNLSAAKFLLNEKPAQNVAWSGIQPMQLQVFFSQKFVQHEVYALRICDAVICDLADNCIAETSMSIGLGAMPIVNEVIINELLFNPNVDGVDFVELYNRSDKIAELQNLRIANCSTTSGAIDKAYLLPKYTLLPGEYVVLTTNPDAVRTQYLCTNPQAFIAMSKMPSFSNESGCVALLDSADAVLEKFFYSEKMHSKILVNTKGVSLERINPNRPVDESSNWLSAAQTVGFATPTGQNSQYSVREVDDSDVISVFPETFSPDGDGYDDVLFIAYAMPGEGYIANISIYDAAGRVMRTLCRNTTLATSGQLSWDGICDNGSLAAIGVYVVYVEVFTLNGQTQRYKKTCVVGRKF